VVDFSEQEYTTYLQYIEAYGAQLFACVLTLGKKLCQDKDMATKIPLSSTLNPKP